MVLKASQFNELCSVKDQEVYFENFNALQTEYINYYFCVITRSMSTISQTTCQQILHMQITILVGHWEREY